jgi:hypothetical protein
VLVEFLGGAKVASLFLCLGVRGKRDFLPTGRRRRPRCEYDTWGTQGEKKRREILSLRSE